jgi:hypothetical protein
MGYMVNGNGVLISEADNAQGNYIRVNVDREEAQAFYMKIVRPTKFILEDTLKSNLDIFVPAITADGTEESD